eukprot:CAMPEP_0172771202 /NCGR_PEP_ID=MMETSP1074-20121228/190167_1 /TAXON_ID=2916 /ORGANISM="Ceratium fusus, Strain PA161109" /LENGTH=387 /DNA_ID=CAMNT_0013607105 /DNA_START=51 /DNA_END=1211 /DNA_ORIENTATION=-
MRHQEVFVSTISGSVHSVMAHASTTVLALKRSVEAESGIPIREQRLLCGAMELQDHEKVLSSSGQHLTLLRRSAEIAGWLEKLSRLWYHETFTALKEAPEHVRANREIILAATENNPSCLQYATEDIRSDRGFVVEVLGRAAGWSCFHHAADILLKDKSFILSTAQLFREHGARPLKEILGSAEKDMWSDRAFVHEAVALVPDMIGMASHELRADGTLMLVVLESSKYTSCSILESIPDKLLSDRDFVLAAARKTCWLLPRVAKQLREEVCRSLDAERMARCASAATRPPRPLGIQRTSAPKAPRARGVRTAAWYLSHAPLSADYGFSKDLRRRHRRSLRETKRLCSAAFKKGNIETAANSCSKAPASKHSRNAAKSARHERLNDIW